MNFARSLMIISALALATSAWAEAEDAAPAAPQHSHNGEGQTQVISGPSLHASLGIRMKKAPDLDTYYSTVGGVKISAFQINLGTGYLSILCPGLQYAGYGVFAPSLTPIIINANIGIGFGVDFFTVRDDRAGGPVGMSLNFDLPKMYTAVQQLMAK